MKKKIKASAGESSSEAASTPVQAIAESVGGKDHGGGSVNDSHSSADSETENAMKYRHLSSPVKLTSFEDLAVLEDEAVWLEAAIRQRIMVRPFVATFLKMPHSRCVLTILPITADPQFT